MNTYLILHHNFNSVFRQLLGLLPERVYVHTCLSVNGSPEKIKQDLPAPVRSINKRFKGNWGGFGIVEATIEGMRQILQEQPDTQFITLLSGADLPVKPVSLYEHFLHQNEGKSFISYWNLYPFDLVEKDSENPWHKGLDVYKLRLRKYYLDAFNTRYSVPPLANDGYFQFNTSQKIKHYLKGGGKSFTDSYKEELFQLKHSFIHSFPRVVPIPRVYGASQWWTMSRKHAEYVVRFHDENPIVREFFRYTMLPDESYIQSILLNSEYKNEIINNNLRYIDFVGGGSHPKILAMEDIRHFDRNDIFFARKFDSNKSSDLIQYLIKNSL